MYFYFLNKSNLKILENKLLNLFKYNISSKILHELLYLGYEYSFIYNYSLHISDFINFIYLLILYKLKINYIFHTKYYEITYNYINPILNTYYYLTIFTKIQLILQKTLYYTINPIYSNLHLFFQNKIKIKYSQLQQLIGYKGYISNIQGLIYDKPIINNYINELNLYEYILSCYGSKKGIIDTALKTADSGYLTKRLVNVTHNLIIKEINCSTPYLFKYHCHIDLYGNILFPISIFKYKILQNNIINQYTGKLLFQKNIYLTKYIIYQLNNLIYNKNIYIYLKSLYLCLLINNICNNCLNYLHLYKYNLGQHIGVLVSSAIGEPGTQMVLRTFHMNSILSSKCTYNNLIKNNIFKFFKYKVLIKRFFKLLFKFKVYISRKYNLIYLINKIFIIKKLSFIYTSTYYINNQIILYNYIFNSIAKNIQINSNNIFCKYTTIIYKYYNDNIIQLLMKNIYNKWTIYNLYTYYIYINYIKLYNLFNKGIIYYKIINKKYNIIYILKSYIIYLSYFYYPLMFLYNHNNVLNINYYK